MEVFNFFGKWLPIKMESYGGISDVRNGKRWSRDRDGEGEME